MPINELNKILAFDEMPTFWIIKPEHYNCDKYCVKIKNNFYSIQLVVGQGSYVRIEKIEDNKGYEFITYENIK